MLIFPVTTPLSFSSSRVTLAPTTSPCVIIPSWVFFHLVSFQIHTVFQDRLNSALVILEKHLSTRTYLATERISLADIVLAAELQSAFSTNVDASHRAKLPNVLRHYETIVNQPNLASIFGSTAFVEKALQYTPPPKEKKEKALAPPAQPKAQKKPKKEEADDDDDDDKPYEEAPKEKNPLDLLPKSTFNLEDWKRAYSNKETRGSGGSLEWFYQKSVLLIVFDHDLLMVCAAAMTRMGTRFGVWTSSTTRN
jgi:Glutathione S-transferase, C-terminal domain/Elongation factor 1 gamma, conserved domain